MNPANKEKGPEGTGYIFTLQGVTYYTDQTHDPGNVGVDFVVNTLVKNLESPTVTPPNWNEIPVGLIGISHPALLQSVTTTRIYDPDGFKAKAAMTNLNKVGSAATGIDGNYGYSDPMESAPMPTTPFGNRPGFSPRPGAINPLQPGAIDPLNPVQSTASEISQLDFVLQFVWKPQSPEEREAALKALQEADAAATSGEATDPATTTESAAP